MAERFYYSLEVLLDISELSESEIMYFLSTHNVRENLEWRRTLQVSLAYHVKKLNFDVRMDIIGVTMIVERYCRPYIMDEYKKKLKVQYPRADEKRVIILAKNKTEITMRKYSY